MPEDFAPGGSAEAGSAAGAEPDSSVAGDSSRPVDSSSVGTEPPAPDPEFRGALESIIYAAEEPVTVAQLASALHAEKDAVRRALRELTAAYSADEHGIEIREVAGGFKFYTKPQHHDAVRRFIKSLQPPLRLSMPALETLSVIAYKQPVTLPEIQEIRGVQAAGVIKTLLERGMITTAGRKEALGRPILYRTTKDFLMRFGLASVDDLPSLKEFEALARAALGEDGILPAEEGETQETAPAPEEPIVGEGVGPE
jgi:segregation and condensation protein B